jgi:hypothetical protein
MSAFGEAGEYSFILLQRYKNKEKIRRDVLAILDMITPCIIFVEIDNEGLFPTIHVSETIPILKPIPVSKSISVSEPVPVSTPIPASEPILPYENFPAGTLNKPNGICAVRGISTEELARKRTQFLKNLAVLIPSLLIYLMEYSLRRS